VQNFTTRGPFFVYVQGAPSAQMVIVPQGGASTVTFTDVADFGATEQIAVVIEGLLRWIAPIAAADVQPNQTLHAGTINVAGGGILQYGAYLPSWHSDGSRLGYIFGGCAGMWQIDARPPAGTLGSPLLQAQNVFACVMDWGPGAALADQLLYHSALDEGIYRVTEGSADGGTRLVVTEPHELVIDLQWLPDGSGFVYTKTGDFLGNANVYHYDFATSNVTPLTSFTGEFARDLALSPDGQFIVFERAPTQDSPTADLWIMRQDGSDMELLVSNALRPAWSRQAPQVPANYPVYLPQIR
jgi:TolB protein